MRTLHIYLPDKMVFVFACVFFIYFSTSLVRTFTEGGAFLMSMDIDSQVEKLNIDIGNRIREARSIRKISQTELGAEVGCGGNQISRYENGLVAVPTDRLQKIAFALDVSVNYLRTGTENIINIQGITLDQYQFFCKFVTLSPEIQDKVMQAVDYYKKGDDLLCG